jgi:DNA-binding Xre family transcriptional regulator
MNENNMTGYQLELKTGIHNSTIYMFLTRKTRTIRIENLKYICEAFNITLGDFFSDKRFDNIEAKECYIRK